jgi:anaerobic selenocysteine-containing dehydrogenase
MEAKLRGATVIHIDPRFTRTSANASRYVPIRAGSDIAFLGGIVNYICENDNLFREYVVAYTNAATIISDDFKDTEDLDGLFSGWDAKRPVTIRPAGSTREWTSTHRPATRRSSNHAQGTTTSEAMVGCSREPSRQTGTRPSSIRAASINY